MRAELQNLADEITRGPRAAAEASLTGIAPLDRLDELNAHAEDPKLWNDPADAQKMMRERDRAARRDRGPARSWSASSPTPAS